MIKNTSPKRNKIITFQKSYAGQFDIDKIICNNAE